MKTINLIILCFLLLISGCTTPETKRTTVLMDYSPYRDAPEFLNGQIKSVKEYNYWAVEDNGVMVKGEIISRQERDSILWSYDFTCLFDEEGLLNKTTYFADNKVFGEWNIEYTDKLISKAIWTVNDTVKFYRINHHDENNYLSSGEGYNGLTDSLAYNYLFKTNDAGFITESKVYNANNELLNRYTYLMDTRNLTNEFKRHNSSDSLIYKKLWTYNEKGFYITFKKMNANNEITRNYTVEYTKYDKMGNWTNLIINEEDRIRIITEREYEYY